MGKGAERGSAFFGEDGVGDVRWMSGTRAHQWGGPSLWDRRQGSPLEAGLVIEEKLVTEADGETGWNSSCGDWVR